VKAAWRACCQALAYPVSIQGAAAGGAEQPPIGAGAVPVDVGLGQADQDGSGAWPASVDPPPAMLGQQQPSWPSIDFCVANCMQ
jgi:hypothetical protein